MSDRSFTRCTLTVAAADYDIALAALLEVAPGGWEERRAESDEGPVSLTFWLDAGDSGEGRDDPPAGGHLDTLRRLGDLSCTAQEDGWSDGWKRFHHPVTVGGVTVRAPWHEPVSAARDVVIDVGMAFGTGAHPTTRGCIAALAGLERGSLADLGTGSGVLALAALRLGFAPVWACDNDPEAVAAARGNAGRNGLDLEVTLADCLDPGVALPAVDVLVANLLLEPIIGLGARLTHDAARGAGGAPSVARAIVLSGILVGQVAAAEAAFSGFRRRDLTGDGEWATLVLEPGAP